MSSGIGFLLHLMETLEQLVVGKAADVHVLVDETGIEGRIYTDEMVVEEGLFVADIQFITNDAGDTVDLFLGVGEDIDLVALLGVGLQILDEKVEVLMIQRMWEGLELDLGDIVEVRFGVEFKGLVGVFGVI